MSHFKGKLAKDSISTIINNVHHGAAPVREEAA
jgi:hypothetical protein